MHRMPKALLLLLAVVLGYVAGGCSITSITVPELATTIETKYGIHPSTKVAQYVSRTGNEMVSAMGASKNPYTFVVLDSEDRFQLSVPVNRADGNLTGERRVYVSSGLLRELDNGAQLRSALALEIALQEAGHVRRTFGSFVTRKRARQGLSKLYSQGIHPDFGDLATAVEYLTDSGVLDAQGEFTYQYKERDLQKADRVALGALMESDYDATQYDQLLEDLQLKGVASQSAFGGLQVTSGRRDAIRSLLTNYLPIGKKVDTDAYRQQVLDPLEG